MTEKELLKNALPTFKKKFGKLPKEYGYPYCGAINNTVVFARSKEAAKAFIDSETLLNKTIKVLCFLILITVIAGVYGIFVGIEEKWSTNQWYLLLGGIVAMTILIGYIYFRNNLRIDGLKLLCPKTEIVTFTEKEISVA